MKNEIKTIFENVDKEILTEDTLNAISTLIESTVNKKVQDRVTLEIESALNLMNEDHGAKLNNLIAKIDEDHTAKVKKVVEHLNKTAVGKLKVLKEKYDNLLKKTAISHRDALVESVDSYLDAYLDKNIPIAHIQEAANNRYVQNVLKEVREVLSVDPAVIKENVKKGIIDGKQQIDKLTKENAELKKAKLIAEGRKFLIEKTSKLPAAQAKFVRERLENKDPKFIAENFKYVVDMYDRQDNKARRSTLNENTTKHNIDRNRVSGEIIKENAENGNPVSNISSAVGDYYLSGLNFRK